MTISGGLWSLVEIDGVKPLSAINLTTTVTPEEWPRFVQEFSASDDSVSKEESALRLISVHIWEKVVVSVDQNKHISTVTIGLEGVRATP